MNNSNEIYMVFKLVTGEQIVAVYIDQTDDELTVFDPIVIKHIPVMSPSGEVTEQVMSHSLCSLTDEREFTFQRSMVVFESSLSETLIPYYHGLLKRLQRNTGTVPEYGHMDEGFLIEPEEPNIH